MTVKLQGVKEGTGEKLKNMNSVVAEVPGLNAFFLFGSYSQTRQTPLSDIDLAYLPYKNSSREEVEALDRELYIKLTHFLETDDITLVNLREAPVYIAYNILCGKQLICHNSGEFKEFKENILNLYPEIARMRNQILEGYTLKLREEYGSK